MSASIHFRTVKPPEGRIDCGWPSAFLESMKRAFGSDAPWRLGAKDIPILTGMAATNTDMHANPYQALIDKIEQPDGSYVEIEVWPEY